MRLLDVSCILLIALVAGCARVGTTNTLAGDGSFQRKVVYTVNPSPAGTGQKPMDPKSMFRIPKEGDGVTVEAKTDDKGVQTVTVTRNIASGAAALQDITLFNDKGEPMATSTVVVKKLDDGRLEYTESLHWAGPQKPNVKEQSAQLRAAVKKALPEEFQKTEVIDRATHKALVAAIHVILGPSEPAFGDILVNHDGAEKRVSRLLFAAYSEALHEAVPEMSPGVCSSVAKTVVLAFGVDQMNMDTTPSNPATTEESAQNDMTPLYFEVAFPGKTAETNGIVDPLTGKVYWSLFATALQVEDVSLHLIVQP